MLKFCVLTAMLLVLAFPDVGEALDLIPQIAPEEGSSESQESSPELPDKITMKSPAGNVVLPHKVHVKDKKLKCTLCHHQIRAAALDTPHPDYLESSWINCQTCHETNSKTRNKYYKCSVCHHSEPDNIADETLSSKVVIHKSCWKCHEAGTGVKASEGCSNCHIKAEESLVSGKRDG